ncbi:MAG: hypothetical protein JXB85_04285 [Anaerolineales bacterium]|nr:hypothetical protein [Anaerolineales bacterium]
MRSLKLILVVPFLVVLTVACNLPEAATPTPLPMAGMEGAWQNPQTLTITTIVWNGSDFVVTGCASPTQGACEVVNQVWDMGILTWTVSFPLSEVTARYQTVSVSADLLYVNWASSTNQAGLLALTRFSGTIPTPAPTITRQQTGAISGMLSYPAEGIPALRVVAFSAADPNVYFYVDTVPNQGTYLIEDLPTGVYHVVAYNLNPNFALGGGYSQAVPCGLLATCTDHSLVEVIVTAGLTIENINPGDWYAPEGSFPAMPNP